MARQQNPQGIKEGTGKADEFSRGKGKFAAFQREAGNAANHEDHGNNRLHSGEFPLKDCPDEDNPEDRHIFQKSGRRGGNHGETHQFAGHAGKKGQTREESAFDFLPTDFEQLPVKQDTENEGRKKEPDAQELQGRKGIDGNFGKCIRSASRCNDGEEKDFSLTGIHDGLLSETWNFHCFHGTIESVVTE